RHAEKQGGAHLAWAQVQPAGYGAALEGHLYPFDPVWTDRSQLVVCARDARIEELLLLVDLEDGMLCLLEVPGGLGICIQRAIAVSLRRKAIRFRLQDHGTFSEVLADHGMAVHLGRELALLVGPPVIREAGLLQDVVEHPLLAVTGEMRPAAPRG